MRFALLVLLALAAPVAAAPGGDDVTTTTRRLGPGMMKEHQPFRRRFEGGGRPGENAPIPNGQQGGADNRFQKGLAQARQEVQHLDETTREVQDRERQLQEGEPNDAHGNPISPERQARLREMLTLRRRLLDLEKQDFAERVVTQCKSALDRFPLLDAAGKADGPPAGPRGARLRQMARAVHDIASGPADYESIANVLRDLPSPPGGYGPGANAPVPVRRRNERLSREFELLVDQLDRVEREMGALSDESDAPERRAPRRPAAAPESPRPEDRGDVSRRLRDILNRMESSDDPVDAAPFPDDGGDQAPMPPPPRRDDPPPDEERQ